MHVAGRPGRDPSRVGDETAMLRPGMLLTVPVASLALVAILAKRMGRPAVRSPLLSRGLRDRSYTTSTVRIPLRGQRGGEQSVAQRNFIERDAAGEPT